MRFTAFVSLSIAGFSLTSAIALPNVDSALTSLDKPKEGKQSQTFDPKKGSGSTPPVTGDLHHVNNKNLCSLVRPVSEAKKCTAALAHCDRNFKAESKNAETCEDTVKTKYSPMIPSGH